MDQQEKREGGKEDTSDGDGVPLDVPEFIRIAENEEHEPRLQMDQEQEDANE
jgi:hypothetical protein